MNTPETTKALAKGLKEETTKECIMEASTPDTHDPLSTQYHADGCTCKACLKQPIKQCAEKQPKKNTITIKRPGKNRKIVQNGPNKKKEILRNNMKPEKSKTPLPDIKQFTEQVDLDRVRYILYLHPKEFEKTFWEKGEVDDNGDEWDLKTYISCIQKWARSLVASKEERRTVDYKYSTGSKFGRLYVKDFGVQSLQHRLKCFLINGKYKDIDMDNCHFRCLRNIVKAHNKKFDTDISCKYIDRYIRKRQMIMKKYNFCKKDAIIALNSDFITANKKEKSKFYTKNEYLQKMWDEINYIKDAFLANDYYKDFKNDRNKDNPKSSFLNKIMCKEEARILQLAMRSETLHLHDAVPMFDGVMIEDTEQSAGIIERLNELTKNIGMTWKEKSLKCDLDITDDDVKEKLENPPKQLYSVLKEAYEADRCYIESADVYMKKFKNIKTVPDQNGKLTKFESTIEWKAIPKSHMENMDKNIQCFHIGPFPRSAFNWWVEDANQRRKEHLDFIPHAPAKEATIPSNVFNTFTGLGFARDDDLILKQDEEIEFFEEYIHETLCNNDAEASEYIMDYLAHSVQYPNINPEICIVLVGEQGTGKDTFYHVNSKLVNERHAFTTKNMGDILNRGGFNSSLKDILVVNFNETSQKEGIDFIEDLKEFIARKVNTIRDLYCSPYAQTNYARVLIPSNKTNPIPFQKGQRRFFQILTNSKRKGDTAYWKKLYGYLNTPSFISKIGNYLLRRDIEQFIPSEFPITEIMKLRAENDMHPCLSFMRDMCDFDDEFWNLDDTEHQTAFHIEHDDEGDKILYITLPRLGEAFATYLVDDIGYTGKQPSNQQLKEQLLTETRCCKKNKGKVGDKKSAHRFVINITKMREELYSKHKWEDELKQIKLDGKCLINNKDE